MSRELIIRQMIALTCGQLREAKKGLGQLELPRTSTLMATKASVDMQIYGSAGKTAVESLQI